ncbi:MAG: biopolymer transporter ExbD [Kiritimatiellaeota bacterium]|nr:biopolymer transporter ExbD [Kiritimatiellota bacterium]
MNAVPAMPPVLGLPRRRFRPQARPACQMLPIVALINVALLVAGVLLMHAPLVLRPGVTVNLPAANFTGGAPYGALVVTLSQEGMVFFNDERTTLEDLSSAFAQAAHEHPGAMLVIEADSRVAHGTIMALYSMARAAGLPQVSLATRLATPAEARPAAAKP